MNIYVLRYRPNVFKIGITKHISNIYKRDIELLLFLQCKKNIEKEILSIFKKKFIHLPNYGNKYFQGNEIKMIDEIVNIYKSQENLEEILQENIDEDVIYYVF